MRFRLDHKLTATPANLRLDPETLGEIRQALNSGKEVITHTDPVSVPGWQGAGYVITDMETGAGAWKIGGGLNGSFIAGMLLAAAIILVIAVFISTAPISAPLVPFLIASAALHAALAEIWVMTTYYDGLDIPCFLSGVMFVLGMASLFVSPGVGLAVLVGQNLIPGLPTAIDCLVP